VVGYATNAYDMSVVWKLVEKKAALALNPSVLVARLHHPILTEKQN
jgi:hypothetical protein